MQRVTPPMQEGISTIITAICRSRMIFRRLETYILYRIASSLLILGFFFFGEVCSATIQRGAA